MSRGPGSHYRMMHFKSNNKLCGGCKVIFSSFYRWQRVKWSKVMWSGSNNDVLFVGHRGPPVKIKTDKRNKQALFRRFLFVCLRPLTTTVYRQTKVIACCPSSALRLSEFKWIALCEIEDSRKLFLSQQRPHETAISGNQADAPWNGDKQRRCQTHSRHIVDRSIWDINTLHRGMMGCFLLTVASSLFWTESVLVLAPGEINEGHHWSKWKGILVFQCHWSQITSS